jgi:hypothetical protein
MTELLFLVDGQTQPTGPVPDFAEMRRQTAKPETPGSATDLEETSGLRVTVPDIAVSVSCVIGGGEIRT